jgi:hypothetical protein
VASTTTFAFDFKPYIGSAQLSDLTFRVGPKLFPAHRSIVFPRCRYLRCMVAANSRFVRGPEDLVVEIPQCRPPVFQALLDYLYTDHLRAPAHILSELAGLALRFRLPRLHQLCVRASLKAPIGPSTFREDLASAVDDCDFSDFALLLDDGSLVHAHKLVLKSRCEYFRTLLECGFSEQGKSSLPVPGIDRDTLLAVLRYIYSGDPECIAASNVSVVDILIAADRFLLDDLKQICEAALEEALEIDICGNLLEVSDRYGAPRLRRVCLERIAKQFPEFKQSSGLAALSSNMSLLREVDHLCVSKHLISCAGELVRASAQLSRQPPALRQC